MRYNAGETATPQSEHHAHCYGYARYLDFWATGATCGSFLAKILVTERDWIREFLSDPGGFDRVDYVQLWNELDDLSSNDLQDGPEAGMYSPVCAIARAGGVAVRVSCDGVFDSPLAEGRPYVLFFASPDAFQRIQNAADAVGLSVAAEDRALYRLSAQRIADFPEFALKLGRHE